MHHSLTDSLSQSHTHREEQQQHNSTLQTCSPPSAVTTIFPCCCFIAALAAATANAAYQQTPRQTRAETSDERKDLPDSSRCNIQSSRWPLRPSLSHTTAAANEETAVDENRSPTTFVQLIAQPDRTNSFPSLFYFPAALPAMIPAIFFYFLLQSIPVNFR